MKKQTFAVLGGVFTGAILFLAVSNVAVAAGGDVPNFKGTLEGKFTTSPIDQTFFAVLTNATGHASHLGRFTVVMPHIVNSVTITAIGSIAFTAANGDKLTADFTGVGSPTATPGVFFVEETAVISGGTGRFSGATGHFKLKRFVDLRTDPGLTTGSFDGTIFSPNVNAR